jgi:hypothetical protein
MSNPTNNNIKVFFDTVGRIIIGEEVTTSSNDETIAIKNPAVVHIVPNTQTGQLSLQILPLFFKEFLADKNESTVWLYNRKNITPSVDFALDFKFIAQYTNIFTGVSDTPAQPTAPAQPSSDVIKLFDE